MKISELMKKIREDHGFSFTEMGKRLNFSRGMIDEDLYKIIDFYYYFRTYVIELENQGEKITFENEFLIHQLADYLVVENEVNDLLDYYKEEIKKLWFFSWHCLVIAIYLS